DDLDELRDQAPRIGLVGTAEWDRGLIGGTWYLENDRDDVILEPRPARQVDAAAELVATGYGRDDVPDLLAVAMEVLPRSSTRPWDGWSGSPMRPRAGGPPR
ncbi:MAG: hypothetical protein ACRDIW_08000, partial [Actinomycetota bacterium]